MLLASHIHNQNNGPYFFQKQLNITRTDMNVEHFVEVIIVHSQSSLKQHLRLAIHKLSPFNTQKKYLKYHVYDHVHMSNNRMKFEPGWIRTGKENTSLSFIVLLSLRP